MNDKELYNVLKDRFNKYDKEQIGIDLLTVLFESNDGRIYINEREKIAVGFYVSGAILRIVFFEILQDKTLKMIAERGISVTSDVETELQRAISICSSYRNIHGDALNDSVITHYHG